jgi:hypothetical protein
MERKASIRIAGLIWMGIVQTLTSVPALLIGTYRGVELDVNRPFALTLEALLREKQAANISLRRLPLPKTGELLAVLSGHPSRPTRRSRGCQIRYNLSSLWTPERSNGLWKVAG